MKTYSYNMGFYNTNTIEEKRVNKLTGDIHINDAFKEETQKREIPIYDAYNIQKRLYHEVEQEMLIGEEAVDNRLMELLEEKGKKEVSHSYVEEMKEDGSKSKGMIPARPKEAPTRNELLDSIPPRGRDGKTFNRKPEKTTADYLNRIFLQNQKIINQNKKVIELLEKIEEKL